MVDAAHFEAVRDGLRQPRRNLYLAPVRHHSPACAWAVRELIRDVKPDRVLIEAPVEEAVEVGDPSAVGVAVRQQEDRVGGERLGHGKLIDSMIHDGLWDPYNNFHMGMTAEWVVETFNVSREDQDAYALQSQQRTARAQEEGFFDGEIFPMTVQRGIIDKETKQIVDRKSGNGLEELVIWRNRIGKVCADGVDDKKHPDGDF